mmetsp:Transcript_18440/g.44399  ORF Transcript_18440/g.44399 Transcript_18440/m.44399 type:complete len:236 (+) Transcript_18440:225-932(+)
MPSRKRNQGRARKAKAAGGAPSVREPRTQPSEGRCRHGCTLPPDHVCSAFVDTCYDEWNKAVAVGANGWDALTDGMKLAIEKYPSVFANHREGARSRFLEDGVNTILRGGFNPFKVGLIADAILFIESYTWIVPPKETMKFSDILNGCKRTAIRFFSKRIPCSCLDDLYAEARETLTKMGACFHCDQIKEHSALMDCSRCKGVQYCSKECQLADWPIHKENCDARRKRQKAQKKG